jgi:hypothetical protein
MMNQFQNSVDFNKGEKKAENILLYYVGFFCFYSPILLATGMVSLSFVFQNFKGFILLGFFLAMLFLRDFIYKLNGATLTKDDNTICTGVKYFNYGDSTLSAFAFAFIIMYISIPMFSNGSVNYWIFSGLIVYFLTDIFIKIYKECILNMSELFLNILAGLASSAIIVTLMYAGGSSKHLFFNEIQSNKEICSMPKNQTFKCNVYKNGELIGNL